MGVVAHPETIADAVLLNENYLATRTSIKTSHQGPLGTKSPTPPKEGATHGSQDLEGLRTTPPPHLDTGGSSD